MAKSLIISKKEIVSLGGRELRYTTFNGEDKFDIRKWKEDGTYEDGVRLTIQELKQLVDITDKGTVGNKEVYKENDEYIMSCKVNDRIYKRVLCTQNEMMLLVAVIKSVNPLTEKGLLEYKVKPKTETKTKAKAKADTETKTKAKPKSNIVEFPKAKPEIEKVITEGEHTIDECKAKLDKEREIFKDKDSQYVIDGLIELCEVDQNFRNNVMREDRNYAGAFEYFASMARNGYAIRYGNVSYLDNDLALVYAIDYFNSKAKKEEKANEESEPTKNKKTNTRKSKKTVS